MCCNSLFTTVSYFAHSLTVGNKGGSWSGQRKNPGIRHCRWIKYSRLRVWPDLNCGKQYSSSKADFDTLPDSAVRRQYWKIDIAIVLVLLVLLVRSL